MTTERPSAETIVLAEAAPSTMLLELNGYLFFGRAHLLDEAVQARLREDAPALRYLVVSLENVSGVDASAMGSFERIVNYGEQQGFVTVLAGTVAHAGRLGLQRASGPIRQFPDLDEAVRWCEERILQDGGGVLVGDGVHSLAGLLEAEIGAAHSEAALARFERMSLESGDKIIEQGAAPPGLFFLESGRLTVLFEGDDEPNVRVRTMRPGTVVGEMSLYRALPASATVVAEMPSVVMHLSVDDFRLMNQAEPTAASWLHWFVAVTLAARVENANLAIRAIRR